MMDMIEKVREASNRFYFNGPYGDAENYYLVKDRSGEKPSIKIYSYDVAKRTAELANARAAIKALREPTDEMVDMMARSIFLWGRDPGCLPPEWNSLPELTRERLREQSVHAWKASVDAILSGGNND